MRLLKNIMDYSFALVGIILLLPVLCTIYLLIYLKMGSPVFFRQKRPGLHGKTFEIYKFRTMTNQRDAEGNLLSDEQRLTKLGLFIRSTSIDEIPQLFNVLKGELSLVGPRPLLEEYLPLYSERQKKRHDVKPGITGWAQINGRNAITWEKKFELDVWYVENWSLQLDIKILFLTLLKAINRSDINTKEGSTMPPFNGNN